MLEHKLIGQRFGKLLVIERIPRTKEIENIIGKGRSAILKCLCDCGTSKLIQARGLVSAHTKSCGCLCKRRPYESRYNRLMLNASKRKEFSSLTFEEYLELIKTPECHYCGDKVIINKYLKDNVTHSYNIDRKDNNLGYTKENCVICCTQCNLTKSNKFTYNEFMMLSEGLRKIQESRMK
jgi:5-methylcytosine-specific restriction endonuclease McrA